MSVNKKRKKVTLEDLKGLVGSADSKSAAVKHDELWKSEDGTEWKGGERTTETITKGGSSSSIKGTSSDR